MHRNVQIRTWWKDLTLAGEVQSKLYSTLESTSRVVKRECKKGSDETCELLVVHVRVSTDDTVWNTTVCDGTVDNAYAHRLAHLFSLSITTYPPFHLVSCCVLVR